MSRVQFALMRVGQGQLVWRAHYDAQTCRRVSVNFKVQEGMLHLWVSDAPMHSQPILFAEGEDGLIEIDMAP